MPEPAKPRDAEEESVDKERQQSGKEGVRSSDQKEEGVRNPRDPDPASEPTEGAYGEMDRESVSGEQPSGAPALDED